MKQPQIICGYHEKPVNRLQVIASCLVTSLQVFGGDFLAPETAMGVEYNRVSREELEATAEAILYCGQRLTEALQLMVQSDMQQAWLPWSASTRRYVTLLSGLGTQALREIEDQSFAAKKGIPSRFDGVKEKSRYEAERRARLAEKSQPPQPEDFPPGSLIIDPGPSGGPRIGIVPNPKPSKKPAKKKGSQE